MEKLKRIISDIIEFNQDPPENIFIDVDKDNITNIKALIIGPKGTPYEDGYYFFKIKMPNDYPQSSPKVKFETIDGKVRFNPNLYQCGKVCLSILGTWDGPSWTPANTLKSVLLSIQSLMSEFPIQNEPGYDRVLPTHDKSINYNYYVTFHKYRLAIIDFLNKNFKDYKCFDETIQKHFKENYSNHLNNLLSLTQIFPIKQEFTSPIYFIRGSFYVEYSIILNNLLKLDSNNKEKSKEMSDTI